MSDWLFRAACWAADYPDRALMVAVGVAVGAVVVGALCVAA